MFIEKTPKHLNPCYWFRNKPLPNPPLAAGVNHRQRSNGAFLVNRGATEVWNKLAESKINNCKSFPSSLWEAGIKMQQVLLPCSRERRVFLHSDRALGGHTDTANEAVVYQPQHHLSPSTDYMGWVWRWNCCWVEDPAHKPAKVGPSAGGYLPEPDMEEERKTDRVIQLSNYRQSPWQFPGADFGELEDVWKVHESGFGSLTINCEFKSFIFFN